MVRPAIPKSTAIVLSLVIIAIAALLLAFFRATDISVGVKKGGAEGTVRVKTSEPPGTQPSQGGIITKQEAEQVKGNLTGVKATDVAPSKLSVPISTTQEVGTVEGTVIGVDLSKTGEKKP